jgi:hypothetical protein
MIIDLIQVIPFLGVCECEREKKLIFFSIFSIISQNIFLNHSFHGIIEEDTQNQLSLLGKRAFISLCL